VIHGVRRDVSPLERGISRYAGGRTLAWMTVAFLMLAVAVGTAAWQITTGVFMAAILGLRGVREAPGLYQRACFALLVVWLMLPG